MTYLDHLTLPELLLLLCWNAHSGAPRTSVSMGLDAGIGGAILLELTLRGHLTLDDRQRPHIDPTLTGVPLLDEAADRISKGPERRTLKGWVRHLGTRAQRRQVRERLVEQGLLVRHPRRLLGVLPVNRHVPAHPEQLEALRDHVGTLLAASAASDDRDAALLGLVGASGAVDQLVPRSQRRAARRHATELAKAHPGTAATRAVIQETQTAVIAAIAAASAAASSSN